MNKGIKERAKLIIAGCSCTSFSLSAATIQHPHDNKRASGIFSL